jgi:hypothetical protein
MDAWRSGLEEKAKIQPSTGPRRSWSRNESLMLAPKDHSWSDRLASHAILDSGGADETRQAKSPSAPHSISHPVSLLLRPLRLVFFRPLHHFAVDFDSAPSHQPSSYCCYFPDPRPSWRQQLTCRRRYPSIRKHDMRACLQRACCLIRRVSKFHSLVKCRRACH